MPTCRVPVFMGIDPEHKIGHADVNIDTGQIVLIIRSKELSNNITPKGLSVSNMMSTHTQGA